MDSDEDAEVLNQLLAFVDQTADFVGVSDPWGRILYLNPAASKRLGVADGTGVTLADIFPLEAFSFYYEVVRPQLLRTGEWSGEVLVNAAGGDAIPMYISTTAKLGPGGETNGGVVVARELPRAAGDERADAVDTADVDEVTGLFARSSFDDRVREATATARRDGESCALVLVEIDGMSTVTQTLGEAAAAAVMRTLAGRITRLARTIDVVGRVDDHQLGLLLRGVRSHREALGIARTVNESLVDPPVTTAGGELVVAIGCGVAFCGPGEGPVDLIEKASANVSHPATPRTVEVDARHEIAARSVGRVTIDDFQVGLSQGEIRPYVEPVVGLASGLLVGYRGLVRWHHRAFGTLDATAFTEMIAETPFANQIDLYIARETAAVLALSTGHAPLGLYAPVSRRLIADVRTEQYLSEIADAFFLSMSQIHLQLDRPLFDVWPPALRDTLQSLRDAGVSLVLSGVDHASEIDGFAEFGFHQLDLARELTDAAAGDPEARLVAAQIAGLAHDRGLLVGGAGVDDPVRRQLLTEIGCDVATGDVFGRPALATTVE